MSLSAQFQKSQQDLRDATRAASVATLDRAMDSFADNFPDAARGMAARAAKGKGPNWFQRRKSEKWVWKIKGYADYEMTPAFFENIPGFRKLRDACADPAMDISCEIYISGSEGLKISIDPTQPFSKSRFSYSSKFCKYLDGPIPAQAPATAVSTAPAIAVTPAPAAADGKITVMTPLRLK